MSKTTFWWLISPSVGHAISLNKRSMTPLPNSTLCRKKATRTPLSSCNCFGITLHCGLRTCKTPVRSYEHYLLIASVSLGTQTSLILRRKLVKAPQKQNKFVVNWTWPNFFFNHFFSSSNIYIISALAATQPLNPIFFLNFVTYPCPPLETILYVEEYLTSTSSFLHHGFNNNWRLYRKWYKLVWAKMLIIYSLTCSFFRLLFASSTLSFFQFFDVVLLFFSFSLTFLLSFSFSLFLMSIIDDTQKYKINLWHYNS